MKTTSTLAILQLRRSVHQVFGAAAVDYLYFWLNNLNYLFLFIFIFLHFIFLSFVFSQFNFQKYQKYLVLVESFFLESSLHLVYLFPSY